MLQVCSQMPFPVDKRKNLVAAAMQLFYEQGFVRTTLAEVAQRSRVPIGNVYYYFRSKDLLAEAVIQAYHEKIDEWHQYAESGQNPEQKLVLWLEYYRLLCLDLFAWGCPFGRLLLDFKQQSNSLGELAGQLYTRMLEWVTGQYSQYGQLGDPAAHARTLISRAQGLSILAMVLSERQLVLDHFQDLENSIQRELS